MAKTAKPKDASLSKKRSANKLKKKRRLNKLKEKATFIGIDLAWSRRNRTGCAIIQNQRLVACSGTLQTDQEILTFIRSHLEDECPAIIGIDAPLKVPNASGSRTCDQALSADWRQFQAGALPANRNIFSRMNRMRNVAEQDSKRDGQSLEHEVGEKYIDNPVRGEVLVALLAERLRFSESTLIPRHTNDRLICEIYPHPAHVSLFGLEKTLKYKTRSGRKYEDRWPEFERYQKHLRALRNATPKLKRTKALLTQTDVRQLRGRALKEYEDILDAITCAYVVNYLWLYGPDRARTYGTLADGHIIVPVTEPMRERL